MKNEHAVAMGKVGGVRKFENLRKLGLLSEAQSEASRARWDRYYNEHPAKLRARKEREKRREKKRLLKEAEAIKITINESAE